jgi:hypothetical protein
MPTSEASKPFSAPRPLFEAGKLRCPHDKLLHDILTYKRFDLPHEFETQLNTVLRCIFCGHVFSPNIDDEEMKFIREAFDAR